MAKVTVNRFFIFKVSIGLVAGSNSRYNPQPMNSSGPFIMNRGKDLPTLLVICLILSLLLHLLVAFLFLYVNLSSDNLAAQRQKPTMVQLVDRPTKPKPKEYELDQKPRHPTAEPPKQKSRLAAENQKVAKEMAPKGEDFRDQTAKPPLTRSARPTPPKRKSAALAKQKSRPQNNRLPADKTPPRPRKAVEPRPSQQPAVEATKPLPSLEQLTQLTPDTLSRLSAAERAAQEKIKQREDVNEGDTVWLNLERGMLISFFRRFRNQIEGVWNYPREAIEKELQGTLLLKITVDTKGKLLDVELIKSSGSDILDFEAIQAVYRAAPFGPLGRHYPYPKLKIMANFRYRISGKYIYGRPR